MSEKDISLDSLTQQLTSVNHMSILLTVVYLHKSNSAGFLNVK